MELPRLFPTPEAVPVALRDIVGKPEVRARMRREALAGLLGACEETDEQRKRRGPEPLKPSPDMRLGVNVRIYRMT